MGISRAREREGAPDDRENKHHRRKSGAQNGQLSESSVGSQEKAQHRAHLSVHLAPLREERAQVEAKL